MEKKFSSCIFLAVLFSLTSLMAQEKKAGPVIEQYGKVWDIPNADFLTNSNFEFKLVFDIMNSPPSHTEINKSIETAARFLNMHARAGVDRKNMKVALVVHNAASKDLITDEAYIERYGVPNPNSGLVKSLLDEGVDIIFCGQSSYSRDFPIEDTHEGVQLALSAMTAIVQLEKQGYHLIKF